MLQKLQIEWGKSQKKGGPEASPECGNKAFKSLAESLTACVEGETPRSLRESKHRQAEKN